MYRLMKNVIVNIHLGSDQMAIPMVEITLIGINLKDTLYPRGCLFSTVQNSLVGPTLEFHSFYVKDFSRLKLEWLPTQRPHAMHIIAMSS